MLTRAVSVLAMAVMLGAIAPAAESDAPEVTQGALRVITGDGEAGQEKLLEFPLQHTDVQAEVAGMVADVTVTQTFANPFEDTIEAVYVFPLPQNAAVNDMTMKIGDRTIRGLIKKREEARQIYDEAREAGQTASLLEQQRPNIFTQSVANITPGAEIRIQIHYVQDLKYDDGTYEFSFPMVVGPRFIPGTPTGRTGGGWSPDTDQVPDASRITPPVLKPGERTGHDISLTLDLDAGVPIQGLRCRSHEVEMERIGRSRARVALKPFDTIPNKDFMLAWDVAGERPEMALLAHRKGDTGGFFTLMIQPKADFGAGEITPKEMIFVVDCSGSMRGEPIAKAKQAMRKCITHMQPEDTFRVIRFSESASQLSQEPLSNTTENIKRALVYIEQMSGSGGTMMIEGIKAALDYPPDPERVRIVSFMTDGYIGNETEILAAIEDKLGEARLFSFGVGTSVNRYLLERMAEVGRGVVQYVRPNEETTEVVDRFYERIARPYLLDIEIDWGGLQVADIYPARIPDLFADQPLVVHGRYTEPGEDSITIRGQLASAEWSRQLDVEMPRQQPRNEALASLWGRARIKDLMDRMFHGEDPEIVKQVTDLALEFRLMSAYTSFVAVEERVVNEGGEQRTVQQPVPMPEGVSYEGVFGAPSRREMKAGGYGGAAYRGRLSQAAPMAPAATSQRPQAASATAEVGMPGPAGPRGTTGPADRPTGVEAGRPTAATPGPPGPEGSEFIALSPWLCTGEGPEAVIAVGRFDDQEQDRVANLAYVASAASNHVDVPIGMVYRETVAVANLDELPEGMRLKAVYLSGPGATGPTDDELAALQAFVAGGGFVIFDGGATSAARIEASLTIGEWDVEIRGLPADHPLFRADATAYDIDTPGLGGIYLGERLVGVISGHDLGVGWTSEAGTELTPAWAQGINLMVFLLAR
ncbi:MAG: VIT domain-containing protein [Armatimonadota bacterium]|nr:VIT domain-containing protein [Armatimonadota bacterium]